MGGLARKATIIENEQRDTTSHLLVFDSGDLFYLEEKKYNEDTRKIHANIIAEAHSMIGSTAFTPGKRDFMSLGFNYINDLIKKNSLNFTSCNIYKNDKVTRAFSEYGEKNLNGYRIAYIGATSIFNIPDIDVYVKDPLIQITNTLEKISKNVDMTILLFNGTENDLNKIQNSALDIDMIFYSKAEGKMNSKASSDGGSKNIPVFTSGNRGKYLNKVLLEINDLSSDLIDISSKDKKIKSSNKYLDNKRKNNPDEDLLVIYKDNKKILNDIKFHQSRINTLEDDISNSINKIKTYKIPLDSKVDSDSTMLMFVDQEMSKIIKGPPMGNHKGDHKGRLPGHPHHGHNH